MLNMKYLTTPIRFGILGSGQLSRMLVQSAHLMGVKPWIYAQSFADPAAQVTSQAVVGALPSLKDAELNPALILKKFAPLRHFLEQVDVVIFENEFVPCQLVEELSRGLPVVFQPSLEALHALQDKLRQKRLLKRLNIPSAEFVEIKSQQDLQNFFSTPFKDGFVLKWSQLGYDGKGVWISQPDQPLSEQRASVEKFCQGAFNNKVSLYAEAKIKFKRELATVACFSTQGEFMAYPLVVSEQERGICRKIYGPATAFGVSASLEERVHEWAHTIAKELNMVGAFALECFETQAGELLVNELAPRVHNSGHYTQDAFLISQFENHWRAIMGLSLGKMEAIVPVFGMWNLLGAPDYEGTLNIFPPQVNDLKLHFYGKHDSRPGRKLGHYNTVARSPETIAKALEEAAAIEQAWFKKITHF